MTRKSIGTFAGLGLLVVGACTGGGGVNDFTLPSGDAPTDPGAPRDRNAPPSNPNDPPFGGVAPPPGDEPPGGGTTGGDCTSICAEVGRACAASPDVELDDCVSDCEEIPARCFEQTKAWIRCVIANGCTDETDACDASLLELVECIGPQPPDGGEGGQGGV